MFVASQHLCNATLSWTKYRIVILYMAKLFFTMEKDVRSTLSVGGTLTLAVYDKYRERQVDLVTLDANLFMVYLRASHWGCVAAPTKWLVTLYTRSS